jgi:hypothetical protein
MPPPAPAPAPAPAKAKAKAKVESDDVAEPQKREGAVAAKVVDVKSILSDWADDEE